MRGLWSCRFAEYGVNCIYPMQRTEYMERVTSAGRVPHFGGVRKAIQQFLEAMQRQKALGPKQEAVLRYLLEDLYA